MKDIKRSGGIAGKWAQESGQWDYSLLSWGECFVVLVDMKRVKAPDKLMTYITILRQRYFVLVVDIIPILWIYQHFVDIIRILWILFAWATLRATYIVMLGMLFAVFYGCGYYLHRSYSSQFCSGRGYYFIGNIASYLACNVRPIFHIYPSSVIFWYRYQVIFE